MTTPYQPAPDGAVTVGGGTWNYGQTMNESLGRAAFEFPMPTLDNMVDLLRVALELLPLEALAPFQGFLGLADSVFSNVSDAVDGIISALIERPIWDVLLQSLQDIFDWLTENPLAQCIAGFAEDTGNFMMNFVQGLFGWLGDLTEFLTGNLLAQCFAGMVPDTGNFLQNLIEGFFGLGQNLWDMITSNALIECLVDWFVGLFGTTGSFLMDALAAIQHLFAQLAEAIGLPVFNMLSGFATDTGLALLNIVNGAGVVIQTLLDFMGFPTLAEAVEFLETMVESVTGIVGGGLSDLADFFSDAGGYLERVWAALADALGLTGGLSALVTFFETVGGDLTAIIEQIVQAITGIANGDLSDLTDWVSGLLSAGDLAAAVEVGIEGVIEAITGVTNGTLADLTEWVSELPILDVVGGIAEAIMGFAGNLTDLAEWVQNNLLKVDSDIPANNLVGQINQALIGIIPVGALTDQPINMLTDPTFPTSATVSPTDGWSWDGTQTSTPTGGSAKVVCDGYNKYLFNKTHFNVVPGQTLNLSAKVKTLGMSGVNWKVTLSATEFHNSALGGTTQVAQRSTAAPDWVTISGDYTVPPGTTSLQFRLGVDNANAGTVWFDDLDCHKSGLIVQDFVENLNTTWENVYSNVFGGSGTGRRWPDAVTAIGAVSGKANTAETTAGTAAVTATTANGTATVATNNVLDTWNKFWEGVFGGGTATGKNSEDFRTATTSVRSTAATAYTTATTASTTASTASGTATTANNTATTANNNVLNTWLNLFGGYNLAAQIREAAVPGLPGTKITSGTVDATRIPGLDGSKITGGTVNVGRIPTTQVAQQINPTSGSGAQISRRNTVNVNASPGRIVFPTSFFDTQDRAATNITTTLSQGMFTVSEAGWYMVELSVRLNPSITFGFSVAPLLFKNNAAFKIGNDAVMGTWGFGSVGNRYAQSSWIVYLGAGESVRAGYDAIGTAVDLFDADASGIETYFSISMMNKVFA